MRRECMILLLLNLSEHFTNGNKTCVKDEEKSLEWWKTAVYYQVYPRSFKDSNGDGIGDLKGIEEKAEHFKDIGVDCVWLSPIFKSPMADFGYDISDYNMIDPVYGTMDDFISLQKKLQSLGIKIILDFVPNHSSDEHEWFKKSVDKIMPYKDYYVWRDGKCDDNSSITPPNNWQSLFSNSAWTWNKKREQYYLHQFDRKQPDLNYRNKDLVKEMKNNLRFWLDLGVDGYRVDAVPFLFEHPDFLDDIRKPEELAKKEKNTYEQYYHPYTMDLDETYDMISQFRDVMEEYKLRDGKTRVMITEAYTSMENTMRYYGDETSLGAHMPFNFGLIDRLNEYSNATKFNEAINNWLDNMPEGKCANWVIGNHDNPRVATRFGGEMVDAMNMLNMLLPGAAFTYMGEEIGMSDTVIRWEQTVDPRGRNAGPDGFRTLSRDPARSPYQWNASANAGFTVSSSKPWLPVNPNYWKLNLDAQRKQHCSHYTVYKRLAKLRKTRTVQRGSFDGRELSQWVYAFTRSLPSAETYLVVMNVGSEDERVDLSNWPTLEKDQTWLVHTPSVNSQYSIGYSLKTNGFTLRPKSAMVLCNKRHPSSSSSTTPSISPSSLVFPVAMFVVALSFILANP
ncbi:maltase A1 isoform X1 [Acyrthosiphon pisum]|uniref:alpha-glucosidase n=2 Tax=Acyrthosiphon pisum TaxID=7029 RepID=A0A8R2A6P6_ACYPI|nr:maltase A1 isoform X1 [Acyrthosiphon pisum]|eukprot:XP_001943317.1 PREDICTED: maltase A1 [Acyrthosiphon pisum]